MIEIESQEEFEKVVAENPRVVADFAAPAWCVPCIRFAPHFEKASEVSDAVFVHIDVDNNQWVTSEYNVLGVPTVMLFEDGKYVKHLESRTAPLLLKEIG